MKYTIREHIAWLVAYIAIFFARLTDLIAGDYDDKIKGWFMKGDFDEH